MVTEQRCRGDLDYTRSIDVLQWDYKRTVGRLRLIVFMRDIKIITHHWRGYRTNINITPDYGKRVNTVPRNMSLTGNHTYPYLLYYYRRLWRILINTVSSFSLRVAFHSHRRMR